MREGYGINPDRVVGRHVPALGRRPIVPKTVCRSPHPWSGRSPGEEGWFGVFERCHYTRALARGDRYAEMETRQQQLEEARQRREQAEEKDAGADAAE